MGPSWYWMPDVFDKYFARFGKKVADYYELQRLDPSYQVIFKGPEAVDIPAGMAEIKRPDKHVEAAIRVISGRGFDSPRLHS